jgi:hypothetical protein
MKDLTTVITSEQRARTRALTMGTIGALLLGASVSSAAAQGSGGSASAGAAGTAVVRVPAAARLRCTAVAGVGADSVRRTMVCERLQERDRMVRRLRELQGRLEQQGLAAEERARLSEQVANLTLALSEASSRLAIDVLPRVTTELAPVVIEEMQRGFAMARRALQDEGLLQKFAPKGWLGLNLEGSPVEIQVRDGDLFLRFEDYPAVVSVDPNSPADRAGVRRGDLVLAYNGQDVRRTLAMSRLLRPAAPVTVKLRRDGEVHELQMVAASAPSYVHLRRADQFAPVPPPMATSGVVTMPRPARAPDAPRVVASGTPRSPNVYVRQTPEGPRYWYETGTWKGNPAIVGAECQELSEELADVIGVKRGILVLRVYAGTPAADAGLRQGDVVVRAAGRDVSTMGTLFATIAIERQRGAESVALDVARKGATRKVTLKWE